MLRPLPFSIVGALVAGALTGLAEALFHLASSGAPDLWSPVYGVVLYALLAAPFGAGAGVGVGILGWLVRKRWKVEDWLPWAAGAASTLPLLGFVLYYLANKAIYAEQGVPVVGLAAIAALLGGLGLAALVLGRLLLGGKENRLRHPAAGLGLVGLLAVGALIVALLPLSVDPRAGFAAGRPAPAALADAPNVLFVMVDTLRADHLGAYGADIPTPHLDALAADGILFEQAFAAASWTRSSGASMWTSRLPSSHNADTKASRLSDEVVTWSEVLHGAGVTTGALINNINLTGTFGFDQGFDTFLYESPEYRFGATESVFSLTWYKVVHKVAEKALASAPKRVETYYQPADVVLADARAFIEANREARWALFVHLMEPHDPYFEHPVIDGSGPEAYNGVGFARAEVEHPDPADAEYLQRVYRDEVAYLDTQVAPFLQWLRDEGLYEDLVVVFTADHGEEFYEHGGWWHGTTLYDEQLHVPLIVKLPGGALAGARVPWQARTVDIAPTIAAAVGVAPDPSWDGADLVADVVAWREAEAAAAAARAEAEAAALAAWQLENPGADPSLAPMPAAPEPDPCATSPYERVVVAEEDFEGNVLGAIRRAGMKLHKANEGNPRGLAPRMLFHVAADPGEQAEISGGSQAICARYPADWASELDAELGAAIRAAMEGAAAGGAATMSRAECESLKALGYLAADEDCG